MVYEKFVKAWKNKDIEAYLKCYHEDWQITFHSTWRIMRLEELSDQIGTWMVTGKFEKHRCLYENEDILVTQLAGAEPTAVPSQMRVKPAAPFYLDDARQRFAAPQVSHCG